MDVTTTTDVQRGTRMTENYDPSAPDEPGQPTQPRHRHLGGMALLAATGLVVGAAAFFGATTVTQSPAAPLTTAQVAARVDPALVDIVTTLGLQQSQAAGTGIVLTSSGEVLTNNHVILGSTSISVTDVGNSRTYHAIVVGYDRTHDVAVLQLQGASGLTTANIGTASGVRVGQRVIALGNAGGRGGTPAVATGKITGMNTAITASDASAGTSERLTGLISHDAGIQPGDSGGPLVTGAGQVIGVDTAASTGFSFDLVPGQQPARAFAIPVSQALKIASQITARASSATVHVGATPFLGVEILSTDQAAADGVPPGSGAAVTGVVTGSPADNASLAAGDVIVSVSGQPVTSPNTLQAILGRLYPGDRVTVGWIDQSGRRRSAAVTLASGPAG